MKERKSEEVTKIPFEAGFVGLYLLREGRVYPSEGYEAPREETQGTWTWKTKYCSPSTLHHTASCLR